MTSHYPHEGGVAEQFMSHQANQGAGTHHAGYGQADGGHHLNATHGNHGTHFNRSSSEGSSGSPGDHKDKVDDNELETIHTNERVGSHTNYYEKGGLRTEGDGEDHIGSHQKMTWRKWGAIVAMCFLWTESQIPVYLFGGVVPEIYADIGGVDRWIWMIIGNLIALAAVAPFTGAISDLIGRRYVAIVGSLLIIIGMCVSSPAKTMNNMIAGMTLAGAGAGINELTAIAGTAELVSTAQRGPMVGLVVFSILPFCPSVMYGQLIVKASSWRYVGLFCGLWAFVGLITTILFYFPPPRLNSEGYSKRKIASRIDYVGGILSIAGVLLFTMGLQWGSQQYAYTNAHVLVPLILGFVLIVAFCFWEAFGTKYPMVPGRLKKDPRVLALTLVITFFSGANFFAVLFFWPTQAYNVYGNDPIGVGLRGLPIGFCIIGGAVISLVLIGVTKGRIRFIMVIFSAMMTAGSGAMAVVEVYNLFSVYGALIIGCIGIGGVIVPCSVITTIICPDDLIATITALTLSIRVIGGAIGFTVYYNIFFHKFVPIATQVVGIDACAKQLLLLNVTLVTELVTVAGNGQFRVLKEMTDQFQNTPNAYNVIIGATQVAFARAYRWVYYISIAFGGITFICACFLGDIKKYMDDHVAVVYH